MDDEYTLFVRSDRQHNSCERLNLIILGAAGPVASATIRESSHGEDELNVGIPAPHAEARESRARLDLWETRLRTPPTSGMRTPLSREIPLY